MGELTGVFWIFLTVAHLVAAAYATSLVTYYVVYERGPADLFANFRYWVGINLPCLAEPIVVDDKEISTYEEIFELGIEPQDHDFIMDNIVYRSNGTWLADAFSCHRCAIPYCAAAVLLTLLFPPLFYFLAICGLTLRLLESYQL